MSAPVRRRTPAGTPVVLFRLRVEPSPDDAAVCGCVVAVVALGERVAELTQGATVEVDGALTERHWKGTGGIRQSHFEILARSVSVL